MSAVYQPQVLDAGKPRDVAVGYTCRRPDREWGDCYVGSRALAGVNVLAAVAVILQDLQLSPDVLIVRQIACGGDVPALLLAPRGKTARVVAIVQRGLTTLDLNLALMRLATPYPSAAEVSA